MGIGTVVVADCVGVELEVIGAVCEISEGFVALSSGLFVAEDIGQMFAILVAACMGVSSSVARMGGAELRRRFFLGWSFWGAERLSEGDIVLGASIPALMLATISQFVVI